MSDAGAKLTHLPAVIYARVNPAFKSYDEAYAADEHHFVVPTSVEQFVRRFVAEHGVGVANVLEVGSGQGGFLEFVRTALADTTQLPPRCLGVDGSAAGIAVAARNYPECRWIADTVQGFLERVSEAGSELPPWVREPFDLVLDKTGMTFISDETEARDVLGRLYERTTAGGGYVYIASRAFYRDRLSPVVYADWSADWMSLAGETFDAVEIYDDPGRADASTGYYKRVYWKAYD